MFCSLDGGSGADQLRGRSATVTTRIDVEERRAGNRARAILLGVVRTPLHDHIPRLQDYLTIIKNQDEFALDHHDRTTDLPRASWPVTTRLVDFGINALLTPSWARTSSALYLGNQDKRFGPSATLLVEYLQVGTLESRFLFTVGKV